jgi:hypothetical protein
VKLTTCSCIIRHLKVNGKAIRWLYARIEIIFYLFSTTASPKVLHIQALWCCSEISHNIYSRNELRMPTLIPLFGQILFIPRETSRRCTRDVGDYPNSFSFLNGWLLSTKNKSLLLRTAILILDRVSSSKVMVDRHLLGVISADFAFTQSPLKPFRGITDQFITAELIWAFQTMGTFAVKKKSKAHCG